MNRAEQNREVAIKVIRILWVSLESHLDFSIKEDKSCETCGDRKFQGATVAEYAEAIELLSRILK